MIASLAALRALYPAPKPRTLAKQLDRLDKYCRQFIALSPFAVLATSGRDGRLDASPRGGAPGFAAVLDDRTLELPDALGNNRLDSLANIVETGRAGLLFMLPGMDETLRVNGTARLRDEPQILARHPHERHPPRVVIEISVEEAYLHCAKALMRSRLWDPARHVDRALFPSMGQMLKEQTNWPERAETQEEMLARAATEI
ncbi:MAG: pyridoxamine 5'-phosphate oxidase family protein [Burkholderiales bacterium]|nr:pyridoxamine 5'-phosphate oxidase family protein [Burkholderiales bacterium]